MEQKGRALSIIASNSNNDSHVSSQRPRFFTTSSQSRRDNRAGGRSFKLRRPYGPGRESEQAHGEKEERKGTETARLKGESEKQQDSTKRVVASKDKDVEKGKLCSNEAQDLRQLPKGQLVLHALVAVRSHALKDVDDFVILAFNIATNAQVLNQRLKRIRAKCKLPGMGMGCDQGSRCSKVVFFTQLLLHAPALARSAPDCRPSAHSEARRKTLLLTPLRTRREGRQSRPVHALQRNPQTIKHNRCKSSTLLSVLSDVRACAYMRPRSKSFPLYQHATRGKGFTCMRIKPTMIM